MKKLLAISFISLTLLLITGVMLTQSGHVLIGLSVYIIAAFATINILNEMTEKLS